MEISNLTGLQEPLKILFQALCDGCSSICMPFVRRWQAKAELETKEMHDDMALVASMKRACEEEIVASIKTNRDAREVRNIVNVYSIAIREMQGFIAENSSFKAKEIDPDWSSVFYDCAKGCSREEMQILWAKILVKQCKGELYNKRTLWTLKNMEPDEAKCLVELAPYLINKSFLPAFVYYNNMLPFGKVQALIDCGCLNPMECVISYKKEDDPSIAGHKIILDDTVEKVEFTGMSLADVGCQLVGLIQDISPDSRFTDGIRSHLDSEYKGKVELKA